MQALKSVEGLKDTTNKEPPLSQPVATPVRGRSSAPVAPDAEDSPGTPEFLPPETTAGPFDETVPADLDNVPCCDSFTIDLTGACCSAFWWLSC